MAQTFVLPRQVILADGSVAAGAVASFYRTGTSTPQNAFTDSALTAATVSVTADSAGLLPKIYLDPAASFDYRVRIDTSSGSLIYQEDDISPLPFSAGQVGAALYARTQGEEAADIIPSNYSFKPGHIKRYGGSGDGSVDDSAAFASMLASGSPELALEDGIYSVSGTHVLSTPGTKFTSSNGVIKVRDQTGAGTGVINLTASDCDVTLDFDFNSLGVGGITVAGDRNRVYAKGKDLTRTVSSGTSESLVKVTGSHNTISAEGYDLEDGGIAGAVPRVISLQGTGANNTVALLKGRNVVDGLVTTQTDTVIDYVDLDGVADNGLYLLSTAARIYIGGGTIRDAAEPLVIECSDVTVGPVSIIDNVSSIALFDASRIRLTGVSMVHRDSALATAFIATRSGNTTCTDITLANCTADINVNNGGIAHFSAGAVNGLKVLGGYYKLTWTDNSGVSTRIVTHTNAATFVVYKGVVVQLEDVKFSPMTGSDILNLDIPDVSADSLYDGNVVINNTAAIVREGAVGAIAQDNLYVRTFAQIASNGLYVSAIDNAVPFFGFTTAAPSAGTWRVHSILFNSGQAAGEPLGWTCTVAGAPGTWIPFGAIQSANTYTPTNVSTDRAFDANATTTDELADVLGTLIADLQASGVLK